MLAHIYHCNMKWSYTLLICNIIQCNQYEVNLYRFHFDLGFMTIITIIHWLLAELNKSHSIKHWNWDQRFVIQCNNIIRNRNTLFLTQKYMSYDCGCGYSQLLSLCRSSIISSVCVFYLNLCSVHTKKKHDALKSAPLCSFLDDERAEKRIMYACDDGDVIVTNERSAENNSF